MASTHSALFTSPSAALFAVPPNPVPEYMPPAAPGTFASAPPVWIPDHVYRAVLDPKVPLTIATVYAVTVKSLNIYNKSTGKKPWAISRTLPFRVFVVLHNVFLAVYSAWTFWGMLGALRRSAVSPWGPNGLAGTVDSFCRHSGAAGLGNAAYFSEETASWHSHAGDLLPDGPSRTAPGRIWNEGLAFYGWIFYLSKFYEVLDTFIILAKGKLSSTLQTYHHAGAMMCMWAGMRYMSSPIWMFAFVNSGIHALMYTYYTVTAFNIRVPIFIKRTLTSMQITQFLVGASYAMLHSFVSYTIPDPSERAAGAATKSPAAASTAEAVATTAVAFIDGLKSMIAGAIGGSTPTNAPEPSASGTAAATGAPVQSKVVPCITTSGETFAIWLNVLYLAPLTYLFVSFFIASYLKRSSAEAARFKKDISARRESNVVLAEKAGWDAAINMEREVYGESKDGAVTMNGNGAKATANGKVTNGKAVNGSPNGKTTHANGRKR